LCLGTTVILKMQLAPSPDGARKNPAYALATFLPLVWLLVVTLTAGYQKMFSPDPRIGFLSLARNLQEQRPTLEQALATARAAGEPAALEAAEKALRNNQILVFNQYLDAAVAGVFIALVV